MEYNGWVNVQFLTAITLETVGKGTTPVGMVCGGGEPSWDLTFTSSSKATLSFPDKPNRMFQNVAADNMSARLSMEFVWMRGTAGAANAILIREYCSDGMREADYGVRIGLTIEESGGHYRLEGCCTVPVAGE